MTDIDTVVPIRTLIADDHPLMLLALENVVASLPDLRIVGRAIDSTELFNALGQLECDVVVTDLFMPGGTQGDGIEIIRRLKARYPNLPLVILTMSTDVDVLHEAIALGANAILSKRDRIDLVHVAVVTALARESYLGPTIRTLLADAKLAQRLERVRQLLSKRELEVFTHYASGLGITEIARQTGRSVKTISAQKCTAMKKLALQNDVDLYRFAIEHGLVARGRST
ncbi:response regulator transcription factor [Trinickia violacea]|uniref:Response regulator transcription factor n=1 Tax=Trinickia violacea TaxID=2571746 RepID=A0A4P8IMX6_9BURK|nr:response regulator transcription factor [Trinickia violacea]QCP48164.1 response regulator transcription factor [Trinickia violacea]